MKVMDCLGNEIKAKQVAFFKPIGGLVTIIDVEQPGVVDPNKPGRIRLEVQLAFRPDKDKASQDIVFGDLMRVYTPDEAAKVEDQINDILNQPPKHKLSLAKKR